MLLDPDWVTAIYGGLMIGSAAGILLAVSGRVLGVSGILNRIFPWSEDSHWRFMFALGVLAGGVFSLANWPEAFQTLRDEHNYLKMAAAGLLVGFGTRRGSGCTSGHGICGIGRLSVRSLVATGIFIATGIATAVLWGMLS